MANGNSDWTPTRQRNWWIKFIAVPGAIVAGVASGTLIGTRIFGLQSIEQAEKDKISLEQKLEKKEDKEHAKEVVEQLKTDIATIRSDIAYQGQSFDTLNYNVARIAGALDIRKIQKPPSRKPTP